MSSVSTSETWLRCSAFEELMLSHDSDAYPCAICLRLELSRTIEAAQFQLAIAELVRRHPLLQARLVRRWWKLWWKLEPNCPPRVVWHESSAPQWPTLARIDLTQDSGLHIDVYTVESNSDARCVLFLQVHHALADGLGCLSLVEELLKLLSVEIINTASLPTHPTKLRNRNRFGLTPIKLLKLLPGEMIGLLGVRQFLMRQPVAIGVQPTTHRANQVNKVEPITAGSIELDSQLTERLKAEARSRQLTMNDLLATAVFTAVHELHRDCGGRDNQWLRMMVPISLREADSAEQLSACNVVSCVFLDRTGQQICHREKLLQSIHDEMALIKRHRLALIFIFSLWIKKIITWRVRSSNGRLARQPLRCHTSFVFSNMARILYRVPHSSGTDQLSVNGLTLLRCQILAPIAPLVSVAITAVQYAGRVTISLRYDLRCITEAQASRLLESLPEHLESCVQEGVTV